MLTKEELIEFETEMATCFDDAMIRAPVHLYNDNEDQIIGVFEEHNIGPRRLGILLLAQPLSVLT